METKNEMLERISKIKNMRQLTNMQSSLKNMHNALFDALSSRLIKIDDYNKYVKETDEIYDFILELKEKIVENDLKDLSKLIGEE